MNFKQIGQWLVSVLLQYAIGGVLVCRSFATSCDTICIAEGKMAKKREEKILFFQGKDFFLPRCRILGTKA